MIIEGGESQSLLREKALLGGRVAILYALSGYALFLPFASLCMAAFLLERPQSYMFASTPLILLIAATVFASRVETARLVLLQ